MGVEGWLRQRLCAERDNFFSDIDFVPTLCVPHSQSGAVPISSLLGVGQLGFWEIGKGGTMGEGWGK
jgi:hypothetical protein